MRIRLLCLSLATAGLLCTGVAFSQSRSAGGGLPSGAQLIGVPVGGTHIPVERQPQHVANPYEGNNDALAQGRELFSSMHCIACHAPEGGGNMGPPLSDNDWIYGGEPDQIYLTIVQGRPNGMPAFGKALTPDSVWKLVTYVRSLSVKPSAPVTAGHKHKAGK